MLTAVWTGGVTGFLESPLRPKWCPYKGAAELSAQPDRNKVVLTGSVQPPTATYQAQSPGTRQVVYT
ncbi:hypothetical protein FRC15_005685 [Serendipita sp. 397]|nr:hypothetical protein FRC15_005685 [Serendipita sp. 397]